MPPDAAGVATAQCQNTWIDDGEPDGRHHRQQYAAGVAHRKLWRVHVGLQQLLRQWI